MAYTILRRNNSDKCIGIVFNVYIMFFTTWNVFAVMAYIFSVWITAINTLDYTKLNCELQPADGPSISLWLIAE